MLLDEILRVCWRLAPAAHPSPMTPIIIIVSIIVLVSTSCGGVAASVCSEVIAKAGSGAKPIRSDLSWAAENNDIESACLLWKAYKEENDRHGS